MRPGQAAPVFCDRADEQDLRRVASMRPGQAAPVFKPYATFDRAVKLRFNEAGAGCPGIPTAAANWSPIQSASMRPGQAAPVFSPARAG